MEYSLIFTKGAGLRIDILSTWFLMLGSNALVINFHCTAYRSRGIEINKRLHFIKIFKMKKECNRRQSINVRKMKEKQKYFPLFCSSNYKNVP